MKVLMFSYNPVPTKDYEVVEGSGLRFWRLSQGLLANGYGDIAIAIWTDFTQNIAQVNGIKLGNFDGGVESISKHIKNADVIIYSPAMGKLSKTICEQIKKFNKKAIVDGYSVLHIEHLTSSGDSEADARELTEYEDNVNCFNYCLKEANFVMVANENQKHFLRGVLSSLGTYSQEEYSKFLVVPAFVERGGSNVVSKDDLTGSKKNKIVVLWFGGIYPWFDISNLIKIFAEPSIKDMASLLIVGGRNPFYPIDNKRFNGQYYKAIELAKKLKVADSEVKFTEWVTYRDRLDIFNGVDVAITLNKDTPENEYSFRIRVADLAGNGVPILTNGGDPLSEELIRIGAAQRIIMRTPREFMISMRAVLMDIDSLKRMKSVLRSETTSKRLHAETTLGELMKVLGPSKKKPLVNIVKKFIGNKR